MGNVHTAGPSEALVVSGGCGAQDSDKKRYISGGYAWAWCCVTDVQKISLAIMSLTPRCEMVETAEGVPLTVTGIAQCKVMAEYDLLVMACEQLLGKTKEEIGYLVIQTLEGHLRSILGTLTVEAVFQDRDQFAKLVREVAAPDVGKIGIEILSFTIKDVFDNVDYLDSLGRAQTANVKRNAAISVAEAERDSGIRQSECDKERLDARFKADTLIADSKRGFDMKQADFDAEVNTVKAQSELAYELQQAKIKQSIRTEEIAIDVIQRRKLIQIEEQEITRKEKELTATVKLPAEAESYKVEVLAAGRRTQTVELARADARRTVLEGGAER